MRRAGGVAVNHRAVGITITNSGETGWNRYGLTVGERNTVTSVSQEGASTVRHGGTNSITRIFCLSAVVAVILSGCARTKTEHRLEADREAYCTIAERNNDPRWATSKYGIEIDPRSRYYDIYDADCSPMPPDDPTSHQYMHCVDGKEGWDHWHDHGDRPDLENPSWRVRLADYVETDEQGDVRLDVDSALRLAYVHSPLHQRQLETLYLSSLDVTEERFRLGTQFFGGNNILYRHEGKLVPASLAYDAGAGKYVVTPPFNTVDSNRMTIGSDIEARRRFATAGELVAGFANSFVFEYTGGNANLASSLAHFSFVQPLLRGAGRDVALEQLTLDERRLLANLRAYGQFRQGFYTQVVIGELGVNGPQRGGGGTTLQSFSGVGGVGGYLGLLQQSQQIRNTEDNLRLSLRTRDRLEALYDNELIDIVQVDQFRQNIEVTRANLLDQTNALKLAVDNYKTGTLGLPADLPLDLDEDLVEQFQLIPRESNPILQSLLDLQTRVGDVGELVALAERINQLQTRLDAPQAPDTDTFGRTLALFQGLAQAVYRRVDDLPQDITVINRKGTDTGDLDAVDKAAIDSIRARLQEGPDGLKQQFAEAIVRLELLSENVNDDSLASTIQDNATWLEEILQLSRGCVLVQWDSRDVGSEPAGVLSQSAQFIEPVRELFEGARADLARMDAVVAERERLMRDDEKLLFQRDRQKLHERLNDLQNGEVGFQVSVARLEGLRAGYTDDTWVETLRGLTGWVQSFLQVVERLALVPAQARLEVITVDNVALDSDAAYQIALGNRLDFMNGRAALVDRWRAIQVAADALQSGLTVTGGGEVRTAKSNPVDFRAATSSVRLGLEFDAPLTRLLERNDYRESLIEYQRSRRDFIQSRDSLQKGLRALLRTLEQRRLQLEIQRRAVSIALRRVDQTQLSLLTPPPQAQPGSRPQINPTTAINLLSAQSSLQNSQNSFLAAWLRYYAAKLRLYRELGIMQLDPSGHWIENTLQTDSSDSAPEALVPPELPPEIPEAVMDEIEKLNAAEDHRDVHTVSNPGDYSNIDQKTNPNRETTAGVVKFSTVSHSSENPIPEQNKSVAIDESKSDRRRRRRERKLAKLRAELEYERNPKIGVHDRDN